MSCCRPPFRQASWVGIASLLLRLSASAADPADPDAIPPLRPPRPEIQPGLWEQYGLVMVIIGLLLLLVMAVVVWFAMRPKAQPPIPPQVRARNTLATLRGRPEDPTVLMQVTQAVRAYIVEAFGLPREEMTTSEFCGALQNRGAIAKEWSARVGTFLHEADEHKFAPGKRMNRDLAEEALELVNALEGQRLEQVEQSAGRDAGTPGRQ